MTHEALIALLDKCRINTLFYLTTMTTQELTPQQLTLERAIELTENILLSYLYHLDKKRWVRITDSAVIFNATDNTPSNVLFMEGGKKYWFNELSEGICLNGDAKNPKYKEEEKVYEASFYKEKLNKYLNTIDTVTKDINPDGTFEWIVFINSFEHNQNSPLIAKTIPELQEQLFQHLDKLREKIESWSLPNNK